MQLQGVCIFAGSNAPYTSWLWDYDCLPRLLYYCKCYTRLQNNQASKTYMALSNLVIKRDQQVKLNNDKCVG